ncbi:MAG TPA: hypothetical protein VNT55_17890, partial [Baekduia sp.]|nr:hypothetical protein [Baekduia sp.]
MLVSLPRRAGIPAAAAALALLVLALPGPARAHDGGGAVPKGMTERQFEQFETAVLGPEHAAEHARLRRYARLAAKEKRRGHGASLGTVKARVRALLAPRAASAAAFAPASGGSWTSGFDIPVFGINAAMLPTGKVLWYAYPNHP